MSLAAAARQVRHDLGHVAHRDALGDADDELGPGVGGLEEGVAGPGRRHEDHGDVGADARHRLVDAVVARARRGWCGRRARA